MRATIGSRPRTSPARGQQLEHLRTGHRPHGVCADLGRGPQLLFRQHADDGSERFQAESGRRIQAGRHGWIGCSGLPQRHLHRLGPLLDLTDQLGHHMDLAHRVRLGGQGSETGAVMDEYLCDRPPRPHGARPHRAGHAFERPAVYTECMATPASRHAVRLAARRRWIRTAVKFCRARGPAPGPLRHHSDGQPAVPQHRSSRLGLTDDRRRERPLESAVRSVTLDDRTAMGPTSRIGHAFEGRASDVVQTDHFGTTTLVPSESPDTICVTSVPTTPTRTSWLMLRPLTSSSTKVRAPLVCTAADGTVKT